MLKKISQDHDNTQCIAIHGSEMLLHIFLGFMEMNVVIETDCHSIIIHDCVSLATFQPLNRLEVNHLINK